MEVTMPTGVLTVQAKPGPFSLDELLGFGARANAKRGFLFVSKVLGKHWPVTPSVMSKLHAALAADIPQDLPGPVVFIAMAETAVGLGQGVFEAYQRLLRQDQVLFLQTTRYRVDGLPLIEFEEAHSHAPQQYLHMPDDANLRAMFLQARTLVLVDDEVSTGNTFVNLWHACRALNPALARAHLITLTNFMGDQANSRLCERFGGKVSQGAALYGEFSFLPGQMPDQGLTAQRGSADVRGAGLQFGRGGLTRPLQVAPACIDALAATLSPAQSVLVLGTGEFMHPPFLLAQALQERGYQVISQSTTRSPILPWGAIGSRLSFADNYREGIANYLYNVQPGQYAQVLICHETPAGPELLQLAATLKGRLLHFKSEACIEEIPVR
jgi:hypothetical protein